MSKVYQSTKNIQLDLFDRLPKKPYCTNNFDYGVRIRTLQSAIKHKYLQVNPPNLTYWLVFDIDREFGALAWEDTAVLPPPTWTTINPKNGHAHLAWGLVTPVVTSENGRQAPIRYLEAIKAAYRELLQADPAYTELITKNPLHEAWKTFFNQALYTLAELAINVDLPQANIKEPQLNIDAGRNSYIFDNVRKWAYTQVKQYIAQSSYEKWYAAVENRAMQVNNSLPNPLDFKEVCHISKSIAKWTWESFGRATAEFSAIQAAKGAKGGAAKGKRYEFMRQYAVELVRDKGKSIREAAKECGVSAMTVSRWTKQV